MRLHDTDMKQDVIKRPPNSWRFLMCSLVIVNAIIRKWYCVAERNGGQLFVGVIFIFVLWVHVNLLVIIHHHLNSEPVLIEYSGMLIRVYHLFRAVIITDGNLRKIEL